MKSATGFYGFISNDFFKFYISIEISIRKLRKEVKTKIPSLKTQS
jgi:hypothetical protein